MMQMRSYSKQELAMLYFPYSSPEAARSHLRRWIRRCPPLEEELEKCNNGKFSKFYSRRQVELIVQHLCEP